jgi:hypothetical protein
VNLISNAWAQAAPVAAGTDLMSGYGVYIAAAVVILVIVGAIWWHRSHPTAAASTVAAAQAAGSGVVSELTSLLHKAHDTIAGQAKVIASPAVQAAVNAPPAQPGGSWVFVPTPAAAKPTAPITAAIDQSAPPWEKK